MRIGLIYGLGPDTMADGTYDEALAQIALADELALDSVLFEEDHARLGCPAPASLAAAAAARTRAIRVGAFDRQPLRDWPVRVAEDWAVLDLISAGRAVLGASPGPLPDSTDLARFREAVELIRLSWTQGSFQYIGEHYTFPLGADGEQGWRREPAEPYLEQWRRGQVEPQHLPVLPRPFQIPHPPLAVAADDDETVAWAARRGLSLHISSLHTDAEAAALIERYERALHDAGRGREEVEVVLAREVCVTTDERVREDALRSLDRHLDRVRAAAATGERRSAVSGGLSAEKLVQDCLIVDEPTEVAARFRRFRAELGVTQVVCRLSLPGRRHVDVLDGIRALAGQVHTRVVA